MIKAMVIVILAGLTFLQGCLPTPTPSSTPSPPVVIFIEITIEVVNATEPPEEFSGATGNYGEPDGTAFNSGIYWMEPNPSISPTPTRRPRKVAPEPTVEATPNPPPAEGSWTCPPIGECTKYNRDYAPLCKKACGALGLTWNKCKDDCLDCWKESE